MKMKLDQLHKIFLESNGVSTDTRESLQNKLYFALKGDNFDGNKFVQSALKKGAKLAVSEDDRWKASPNVLIVADVLETLQQLAAFHRKYLNIPVIALTGSNGKTTTKELVARVLDKKYKVGYTKGNLNNHIGVPLTLLGLDQTAEIAVIEMGANHPKEIQRLCEIAAPDYGYITNFGKAHLEGFGGFEGVIKAKTELYDFLKEHSGKIFVNADDRLQVENAQPGNCISIGSDEKADFQIQIESQGIFIGVRYASDFIESRLTGDYNGKNIAAAVGIGNYFKVPANDIREAIHSYIPENNRSQILRKHTNDIILDAYNANPTSMRLSLENIEKFEGNRIVLLGDMFEVGKTSAEEHQSIVDFIEESLIDQAYVCGESFFKTVLKEKSKIRKFKELEGLKTELAELKIRNSVILIKGSRGMAMERLLEVL